MAPLDLGLIKAKEITIYVSATNDLPKLPSL